MKLQLGGLILAATLVGAGSASAASINLDGGGTNVAGSSTIDGLNVGNTRTYTNGSVVLTVTGWTNDTSYSPDQLVASNVGAYAGNGLGVSSPHIDTNGGTFGNGNGGAEETGSGNQHTVDNNGDGRVDFLVLKFNQQVDLTSAYFNVYDVNPDGSADGDAVAYYKNGALAPVNLGNATNYFSQFTAIALDGSSSGSRNIGGVTYSDTWVIGAKPGDTNDGFKLYSISYDTAVPEPATWLTMIVGFGAIGAVMRRRRLMAPIAA